MKRDQHVSPSNSRLRIKSFLHCPPPFLLPPFHRSKRVGKSKRSGNIYRVCPEMFDLLIIDRTKTWIALSEECFFFSWLSFGSFSSAVEFLRGKMSVEYHRICYFREKFWEILYSLKSVDDCMNIKRCESFYSHLINWKD